MPKYTSFAQYSNWGELSHLMRGGPNSFGNSQLISSSGSVKEPSMPQVIEWRLPEINYEHKQLLSFPTSKVFNNLGMKLKLACLAYLEVG